MTDSNIPRFYLYRRIVLAKLFIDKNFDRPINLNDIAREASFSKFHFIRLFKKAYGRTPHQYLISIRIEKAKSLLLANARIEDIIHDVGFEEVSSFTHLFRKLNGITPSAYQKRQVMRNEELSRWPLKFVPNCFAEYRGWTKDRNFQQGD